MRHFRMFGFIALLLASPGLAWADAPLFSGPQVGEKLPSFKTQGVFGDLADKEYDLIAAADGKPVVLIFVHARTRPAFGLTNTIMKWAAGKAKTGLHCGVVFLTDDATPTLQWMHRVEKHFPQGAAYVVSLDGAEGPGSYGLNRNVALTVLVGKQGVTTANFALVQPSLQADGPKILQAIADVAGGGKVPSIAELEGQRYKGKRSKGGRRMKKQATGDPQLAPLIRSVINKQASEDDVAKAAAAVEKYVAENEAAKKELGRIAHTVVNSGKLANYGTEAAQTVLRRWAKQFAARKEHAPKGQKPSGK